jgi:hypothetical protein
MVRGISYDKIWCPVCGVGVSFLAEYILDHELVSQEGRDTVKEAALEIEHSLYLISTEESHTATTYDEEIEDTAGTTRLYCAGVRKPRRRVCERITQHDISNVLNKVQYSERYKRQGDIKGMMLRQLLK